MAVPVQAAEARGHVQLSLAAGQGWAAWWHGEGHEGGRAAPRELPVPLPAPR